MGTAVPATTAPAGKSATDAALAARLQALEEEEERQEREALAFGASPVAARPAAAAAASAASPADLLSPANLPGLGPGTAPAAAVSAPPARGVSFAADVKAGAPVAKAVRCCGVAVRGTRVVFVFPVSFSSKLCRSVLFISSRLPRRPAQHFQARSRRRTLWPR